MKFFNKLEEKFNQLVIAAAVWTYGFLLRIIPGIYQRRYDRIKGSVEEATYTIYQKALVIAVERREKTESWFQWLKRKLKRLKGGLEETFHNLKNINIHHLKNPRKCASYFMFRITPLLNYLKSLSPQRVAGTIIISVFTGLSFLGVFSEGNRILEKAGVKRSPASMEEEVQNERKSYHKEDQRQLVLTNITIPVHFVNINEIRKTDIEFSITTSNRYTKKFIEQNEYRLKDHFFMTVEPIVPSFPLVEEGKDIIKSKIKDEINNFLKINNVEGEIKNIEISYILAV